MQLLPLSAVPQYGELPSQGVLLSLLAISLCVYTVSLVVYRLVFHPLARFPGPKLAAATKWYEFYYDLLHGHGGQFSKHINWMHEKYGPIVRINPHELHVQDPDWYEVLYAPSPACRDKYPPAAQMAGTHLSCFGTVDHDIYRKRRAANAPLFSVRAVAAARNLFDTQIERLEAIFAKALTTGEPVELFTTLTAFSTDTMGLYAFNLDFGLLADAQAAVGWRKTMQSVAGSTPLIKQFPWMTQTMELLPPGIVKSLLPDIGRLLNVHSDIQKQVDTFMSTKSTNPNPLNSRAPKNSTIFHILENSSLPPHEKDSARLQQEGVAILLAGGETVARVISHAIFHLLTNPGILAKVKQEVNEAFAESDGIPELRTLENLTYLSACIREALRLATLVTSRFPLMARTELVYDKWVIPAGTPISMTPADVLHDPSVYKDPLTFKPERWFNATERENRCFVPFGKGTRMCQGMNFAYAEVFLTISSLIHRFNLQLFETYRERDIDYVKDCFLGEADPKSPGIRVKVVQDRLGEKSQ